MSFLAEKDFLSANKLRTFGINFKTIYARGYRTTPGDKERSVQEGHTWKTVIFFSGNNASAKTIVATIIDKLGFACIDPGRLEEGGNYHSFREGHCQLLTWLNFNFF